MLGAAGMRAAEIIVAVASDYGLGKGDLVGRSRRFPVVRARQEAMWRLRTLRGLSLAQIGRMLGGRDHTTILHGVRRHEARL